ncbi:MAG: histidinol phosphate phosphatase domain-containing protein [Deltaproteobacteria bacterium]|nr:histidinol phosphate phosphatase domain-containing protein [Deltaproteobacteria bacterium]
MIDLHTHSLFSDGELIPSELVQRANVIGYSAIAITDHSDFSNLDFIVPRIVQVSEDLNRAQQVLVVPGIELTHVPPGSIGPLVEKARKLGAKLIIVHGETIVEPVPVGTNRAALEAGADILAHPGLISADDVKLAVEKGVFLEISARAGHSYTNGYVAKLANEAGAGLIINSDTHSPGNLMNKDFAEKVVEGAGLPAGSLSRLLSNARVLLEKIGCST